MSLFSIFVTSILTGNIVLFSYLGVTSLVKSNNKTDVLRIGTSTLLLSLITTVVSYLLNTYILIPLNIEFISTILFVLLIVSLVELFKYIITKYYKKLYSNIENEYLLLITNCAIFGVVLLNINNSYSLVESIIYSIGSSIGFTLLLYIISNLKARLDKSPIIKSFKGLPILLITLGIIAMIFIRYN